MANVSIVVVSHSAKLGNGLAELLRQLSAGQVHVASAAGLRDGEIGTDATLIIEVLQDCPADSEIVMLFDVGSALLSCEMALELLPEDIRNRVSIADAPLVEGAIAAVVEASLGSPREKVVESAEQARNMKKISK
jgi:PTS hybrid protein